jgi:hypothetical protein
MLLEYGRAGDMLESSVKVKAIVEKKQKNAGGKKKSQP